MQSVNLPNGAVAHHGLPSVFSSESATLPKSKEREILPRQFLPGRSRFWMSMSWDLTHRTGDYCQLLSKNFQAGRSALKQLPQRSLKISAHSRRFSNPSLCKSDF